MSWSIDRPIYGRLPEESQQYQGNDVADWLTEPWDKLLTDSRNLIDTFYTTHLNPATADAANLDWLAQLSGYTGAYWDNLWPTAVKRTLITEAFSRVWPEKGSRALLEWVIALFGLEMRVYILGDFLAGINAAGDMLGSNSGFQYFLRVRLIYSRNSQEWLLLERLNRLYSPVYVTSQVCYQQFYAGFSVAGDPVFNSPIF
ncbi:MAG: hypothetical protein EBZ77_03575 [Chitinophagia bacterium]|nr:hypothetical protein [Chitinophagia bacterium]